MSKLHKSWNIMFARWMKRRYFNPAGRLLDLGAGDGTTMEAFEKIGFETRGCDLNPRTKKIKKVDLEKGKLPYKNNYFDYAISKWVIEYLTQAHNMLSETRRVLKPEGRIAVLTTDFSRAYKKFYDDFEHKRPYTKHSLRKLFEYYNFNIIDFNHLSHAPFIWRWTTFAFDLRIWPRVSLFIVGEK